MDRAQLLNDPEEALRISLDSRLASVWTAIPGQVTAVDMSTMTLSVQPLIKGIVTDENGKTQNVNLPVLIHVPVQFPMAGGFALTLPVTSGDEVLVVFSSRCIDAWWQSGGIQAPMELRMHDLSDGFAIVGIKSVPNVISNISTTAAQLRNNAGTSYIELSADGKVKLVSSSEIDVTAPAINLNGAVVVSGALTAASVTTAGALAAGTGTIGGIPFATHRHTGITTGGGTSGGPV